MKILKADHGRLIEISGVRGPVPRPVDIDQSNTGFATLRTLRIYTFAAGALIEGHAEEDEVFLVVLSGTVELTLVPPPGGGAEMVQTLCAPEISGQAGEHACAAYLPPHSGYRLLPATQADVAYARATPSENRPATIFRSAAVSAGNGAHLLLEQTSHAQHLQLRLLSIDASSASVDVPATSLPAGCETLLHVRTLPPSGGATLLSANPAPLASWDTVVCAPGESPSLAIGIGATASLLVVSAC